MDEPPGREEDGAGATTTSTGNSVRETQCHPFDEERVWNDGKFDLIMVYFKRFNKSRI